MSKNENRKNGYKVNVIRADKYWKIVYVACRTCRYAKSVRVQQARDSDLELAGKIQNVKCHKCEV